LDASALAKSKRMNKAIANPPRIHPKKARAFRQGLHCMRFAVVPVARYSRAFVHCVQNGPPKDALHGLEESSRYDGPPAQVDE